MVEIEKIYEMKIFEQYRKIRHDIWFKMLFLSYYVKKSEPDL